LVNDTYRQCWGIKARKQRKYIHNVTEKNIQKIKSPFDELE